MSNGQEKKRFSARVTTDTLAQIEGYQEENNLETRSNAIEVLVEESLADDPERPEGLLGSLLYDAEQMKHTALLVAAVLVAVSGLVTAPILPGVVDGLLMLVATLYLLTAFFGFTAPIVRRLSPSPAAGGADEVEA